VPNYQYKCEMCKHEEVFTLPMSTDPNAPLECPACKLTMMTRRIMNVNFICNTKESLGKWYKRKTGKELLGGD
jgi:putative FmdB family regulatory protein